MEDKKEPIATLTIHNKVSTTYKPAHVDGAFGGITPRGLISLSFFAERFPIPKSSDFEITEGRIGEKIADSVDSKLGILREYEVGVYMDINVAREVISLLTTKVQELEIIKNNPR